MTKEQETIERLKYLLFIYKEDDSNKYKSTGEVFRIDFEAIETALSMLKEKDKEIEKYKYLYQKALDNTVKADRENIKKDKQIDFMSEYIASLDIEEDICSKIGKENCDKMSFGECEDCIKQYFERKTTNNG